MSAPEQDREIPLSWQGPGFALGFFSGAIVGFIIGALAVLT